jgi:ribosomal protein L23
MSVERVNTINYQGKKKRQQSADGKPHYYRWGC